MFRLRCQELASGDGRAVCRDNTRDPRQPPKGQNYSLISKVLEHRALGTADFSAGWEEVGMG